MRVAMIGILNKKISKMRNKTFMDKIIKVKKMKTSKKKKKVTKNQDLTMI